MNNKIILTCPNCKSANPYYNLICKQCNYFLREKISNINLGEIILQLIESPKVAFEKIIFSENKNFVGLILIFISLRFYILSKFISVPGNQTDYNYNLFFIIIYFFSATVLILILLTFITDLLMNWFKIYSRKKDIFAVIVYSFLPSVFAVVLLYPIELAIYGKYLFSNNPYPFDIKENVFYMLIGFEFLIIIWSFFLHIKSLYSLKIKLHISVMLAVFNYSMIILFLYISTEVFKYL